MTQYYLRKRVDIIVESPLVRMITRRLDSLKVSGYSVLQIIEGRGISDTWSSAGQISDATNMLAVLCFVHPSQVDAVIEDALNTLKDHIGFVTVSDVYVVRPERFAE